MVSDTYRADEHAEDPLLTPQQRDSRREARRLQEHSRQLVERLAKLTRPKELLHRFPPPGK